MARILPAASEAVTTASNVAPEATDKVLITEARTLEIADDGTETRESMLPHLNEAATQLNNHWQQDANKQEYAARVLDTANTMLDTYDDAKAIVITVVSVAKFLKPITEWGKRLPLVGGIVARIDTAIDKVIELENKYGDSARRVDDQMTNMRANPRQEFIQPAAKIVQNTKWVPRAISVQQRYEGAKERLEGSRVGGYWNTMMEKRKLKKEEEERMRIARMAALQGA